MIHHPRFPLEQIEGSPVKPTPRFCRAVLAQVFNRDNWEDDVTWAEAVVILGAKLLKDAGHENDHIISIFRFFREDIVKWTEGISGPPRLARMLILAIMDNRCASLLGAPSVRRVFDFRRGVEATTEAPVPILQVSVTLSGLLSLLVAPEQSDRSAHEEEEVSEAALPDRPAGL